MVLPSGENATLSTISVCPLKVRGKLPFAGVEPPCAWTTDRLDVENSAMDMPKNRPSVGITTRSDFLAFIPLFLIEATAQASTKICEHEPEQSRKTYRWLLSFNFAKNTMMQHRVVVKPVGWMRPSRLAPLHFMERGILGTIAPRLPLSRKWRGGPRG